MRTLNEQPMDFVTPANSLHLLSVLFPQVHITEHLLLLSPRRTRIATHSNHFSHRTKLISEIWWVSSGRFGNCFDRNLEKAMHAYFSWSLKICFSCGGIVRIDWVIWRKDIQV